MEGIKSINQRCVYTRYKSDIRDAWLLSCQIETVRSMLLCNLSIVTNWHLKGSITLPFEYQFFSLHKKAVGSMALM